jgi:signal transduction histidine kinase
VYALLQLFEMTAGPIEGESAEYVRSMHLTILSGLESIQNLRDMREIDFEDMEVSMGSVSIGTAANLALRPISQRLQLKNQHIDMQGLDEVVIQSDEFLVSRVLENLFSNASKFSKAGKTIRISAEIVDGYCEVSVADEGEGIKEEEEAGLYERFKKLSPLPTAGESAVGLGLSNAQAMAKMLGGTIELRRPPQQGSVFVLRIPASTAVPHRE